MNAAELERNGFSFFTCIEECCVVIEKNIDRKPAKRELVTKYDKNDALKEVQNLRRGSISACGVGRGECPNPRGSKSAVTPGTVQMH